MKSTRFYFTLKNIPLPYLHIKRRCVGLFLLLLLPVMASAQVIFEKPGTTLEQASAKAKAENKLIFMWYDERLNDINKRMKYAPFDMFADPKLRDLINPRFVSIAVDRNSIYAAQLMEKDVLSKPRFPFHIFNANGLEMAGFEKYGTADFITYVSQIINKKNSLLQFTIGRRLSTCKNKHY